MNKFRQIIFCALLAIFLIGVFFVFANTADAAGLVPCGRTSASATPAEKKACTKCDIFVLLQNIFNYLALILVPVIATLLIVIGGFMMLLGGAKPSMFASGKTLFWNVMIGLLIFYGAWMITNTVLRSLAGEANPFAAWNKITCGEEAIDDSLPPPGPVDLADWEKQCAKCGEGALNICDEAECTELGGFF